MNDMKDEARLGRSRAQGVVTRALALCGAAAALSCSALLSGPALSTTASASSGSVSKLVDPAAVSTDFAGWAQASGVQAVSGDFNNDGRDDIALVGGPGWNTVPVAFSRGNGRFDVTNHQV